MLISFSLHATSFSFQYRLIIGGCVLWIPSSEELLHDLKEKESHLWAFRFVLFLSIRTSAIKWNDKSKTKAKASS